MAQGEMDNWAAAWKWGQYSKEILKKSNTI